MSKPEQNTAQSKAPLEQKTYTMDETIKILEGHRAGENSIQRTKAYDALIAFAKQEKAAKEGGITSLPGKTDEKGKPSVDLKPLVDKFQKSLAEARSKPGYKASEDDKKFDGELNYFAGAAHSKEPPAKDSSWGRLARDNMSWGLPLIAGVAGLLLGGGGIGGLLIGAVAALAGMFFAAPAASKALDTTDKNPAVTPGKTEEKKLAGPAQNQAQEKPAAGQGAVPQKPETEKKTDGKKPGKKEADAGTELSPLNGPGTMTTFGKPPAEKPKTEAVDSKTLAQAKDIGKSILAVGTAAVATAVEQKKKDQRAVDRKTPAEKVDAVTQSVTNGNFSLLQNHNLVGAQVNSVTAMPTITGLNFPVVNAEQRPEAANLSIAAITQSATNKSL